MQKRTFGLLLTASMLALPSVAPPVMAAVLTVNDGASVNSYVPFHFYYLDNQDCKTQVIYPASQLADMAGEDIREVQFYLNDGGFGGKWCTDDMIVSLGECQESTLAPDASEFLTVPLSVAYSGYTEGEEGGRLLTFKLSTPYRYSGSNLVVQISLGKASKQYPRAEFLGVATEAPNAVYTTNGSSVTADSFLPKTTFTYGEQSQFEAVVDPLSIAFPLTLVGQSSTSVVKVTNTGVQPLRVELSSVSSAQFIAESPAAETVATGETAEIPVRFTPDAAGDFAGEFSVGLGEAGTFTVAVAGSGMVAPTGVVTSFDVASKTLPEGWTGWLVTDEWDVDAYDYVFKEAKEGTEYFQSYTKDGVASLAIDEGNPIRDYPNRHSAYMISPSVGGDVLLRLASTASNASLSSVEVYAATPGADGSWTIGSAPLDFTWAAEPGAGWGVMIGDAGEGTHLAIQLSYMAIARFAAEKNAAGGDLPEYVAEVTPEAIDFGTVLVGKSEVKQVMVKNTGTKEFSLSVASMPEGPFAAEATASTVLAAESALVEVTFTPDGEGDFAAEMQLDLGEAGMKTVSLTAKAVAAEIGSEFEVGGVAYVVLSNEEVEVSGVSSELTECVVPAEVSNGDGMTFKVVSVGRDAFYWSNVAKVTLPEGVREIGYGAFRSSPLAEINLPQSLTKIGDYAFRSTALTSIVVPEGVTELGSSVFASCEQLLSVTLPKNLVSIGSGAFYKAAISSIDIPATCVTIGVEAFEGCRNLTQVNLPEGLTEIAMMLFYGCENLTSVAIPSTVTAIGSMAFVNSGLEELNLPASVARIASSSFNGAPVSTITVADGSTSFKTIDGVLYSADGGFLYLYPRTSDKEEYVVAEGCRGIIGGAFYECKARKVVLPQSVIGIDEYAFCLSDLEEINLPEGIVLINEQAFAGTRISEVVLPGALENVADGLFAGCASLRSVTLPASVTLIGRIAFYGCNALTEIIAHGEVPAEFDSWDAMTAPFLDVDCDNVTVYCPDGADVLRAYQGSEWADFFKSIKNICDRPESGIAGAVLPEVVIEGGSELRVELGSEVADVAVYAANGQRVRLFRDVTALLVADGLQPGIYVVAVGNGSFSRKVKVAIR